VFDSRSAAERDPEIARALSGELRRQHEFLELIASENYVSLPVLAAQGSVLTNKYADGYPGARNYRGCEYVDVAESLARERACKLFGADYANVQPYSGSIANAAVYAALMEPGDRLLGMRASHGGHITHGDRSSFSGALYDVVHYGVSPVTGEIDYEEVESLAHRHRPRTIVAGFSAYTRVVDWSRFRAIADSVDAWLVADMAHVAGLVAAGLYPSPVPEAHVTTSTTHKTLRGPRGGMILARGDEALFERLDRAVYPTIQGGPLMHVIAAKAIAFLEAMQPEFVDYQRDVLANARRLAARLSERRLEVVGDGTDSHMVLLDLRGGGLSAAEAELVLESAHIAVNRVRQPGDEPETTPSGIRMGTAAVTTRGLRVAEIDRVADICADLCDGPRSNATIGRARQAVRDLCDEFPIYPELVAAN
jgi:glycine hydroxymethyltransferase